MLERQPENALVREGKKRHVWVIKAERLVRGFPDRMLLAPGGLVAFVELKRPGQKLSPAQRLIRKWLKKLGFLVVMVDTPQGAKDFFSDWLD